MVFPSGSINTALHGPVVVMSASDWNSTPNSFSVPCIGRRSSGLNVRMFPSNIPWNKPIAAPSLFRMRHFCVSESAKESAVYVLLVVG